MKQQRKFLILAIVITICTAIFRTSLVGHSRVPTQGPVQKKVEVDQEQWPITDYNAPEPDDIEKRAERNARNARHDNARLVHEPEKRPGVVYETTLFNDWEVGLPALPASKSDTVIVGEVLDANAYLSNDKTGVYSEFTIKVDDILKNDQSSHLNQGSLLVAERLGGRVRFPSGEILPVQIAGQGMPRAGRRYVLFLSRTDQGLAYGILTGYELRAGKVSPLDGIKTRGGGSPWKFDKYENWDESTFIDAVRAEIANPSS
jgi:hypothetical protein